MKQKKIAIFIVTAGLFLLGAIIALVVARQGDDKRAGELPAFETKVGVSGIEKVLPKIGTVDEAAVQASLKGIIRQNVENPKESYTTNVREGSFTSTIKPSGAPLKRFVVDIPELERSFVIEVTGSDQYGSTTLYALCPTPSDLVYKQQECNDTP